MKKNVKKKKKKNAEAVKRLAESARVQEAKELWQEPEEAAGVKDAAEPEQIVEPQRAVEPGKESEPEEAAKIQDMGETEKAAELQVAEEAEKDAEPQDAVTLAEKTVEPKDAEEAETKDAEEVEKAAGTPDMTAAEKIAETKDAAEAEKDAQSQDDVTEAQTLDPTEPEHETEALDVAEPEHETETPDAAEPAAEPKAAEESEKTEEPQRADGSKVKAAKAKAVQEPVDDTAFRERLARHHDELRWLYMELYDNDSMFAELCERLHDFYIERNEALRALDLKREADHDWYKGNDLLGMMFYIDNFAGNMKGVESKLDYIEQCDVNYIHLMPFLDTPKGRSDGGYAVSDFRKVQPKLGTMEDLDDLTAACHERGINVCMDFVMNHTSEDHEWAKRARAGEGEYMSRYFFFDNSYIPSLYDKTVPQVFPTTAPGNFTWLEDAGHFVMTSFYPYQWDLNYKNPRVFNEMMYNFLYLANRGIDIVRIDAVPYIWKELNTQCRNLPQVHTIVRMMRMISEIVCPSVLLLGEVVMEPEKVVPYFGTVEKPECHMLYNVTTMATTWHTVATRDTKLLKRQLDIVNSLPKEYVFLNYLRCHDDIGWGLDYAFLEADGIEERAHKKYLSDYFQGFAGESNSRGELYNADPVTGDARFCGTTASMCGIEKAGFEQDEAAMERAIRFDVMLHAYMFMQSGIPIIYSGDEVGQVNDYTYKNDPEKAADSRYIHRGAFDWSLAANCGDASTVQGKVFGSLKRLEQIRRTEQVFVAGADTWTIETWEPSVLCIGRYYEGEKLIGLFNFSESDKTAWINETDGDYVDLISGDEMAASGVNIPAYGFYYLKKKSQ